MGRISTGIRTVEQSRKLDFRWLLKNAYIVKGEFKRGILSWQDGATATYECDYTVEEKYLRIQYSLTDRFSGIETKYDYKIKIETIDSNLGRGEIPYFVCPLTDDRAKVLIMAYGYGRYVHRGAYGFQIGSKPLYYRVQQVSSLNYHNVRYFNTKKKHDNLFDELLVKRKSRTHYRNKPSKSMIKLERLRRKLEFHDNERRKILDYQFQNAAEFKNFNP